MPPEILNPSPLQRIAPSLGVDLGDRIALSKNMGQVIDLPPLQHFHCSLVEWRRVRPAVFVIRCRHQVSSFTQT
jgi:hypothetical protein